MIHIARGNCLVLRNFGASVLVGTDVDIGSDELINSTISIRSATKICCDHTHKDTFMFVINICKSNKRSNFD